MWIPVNHLLWQTLKYLLRVALVTWIFIKLSDGIPTTTTQAGRLATTPSPMVDHRAHQQHNRSPLWPLGSRDRHNSQRYARHQPGLPLPSPGRIIEPGSRPQHKSDSDPSVSCADNHYQAQCANYNRIKLALSRQYDSVLYHQNNFTVSHYRAQRLACTDFYNHTDDGLLWWQALRKQLIFNYQYVHVHVNYFEPICTLNNQINFYVSETEPSSSIAVEWDHDWFLRYEKDPEVFSVCFSRLECIEPFQSSFYITDNGTTENTIDTCYLMPTSNISKQHMDNVAYSLLYCLHHYGDGILHDVF